MTGHHRPRLNLAALLLYASDWFNDALLARLASRGWPSISRSQSQTFAYLAAAEARPAQLAARIGITRQSMHTLLSELEDHELISLRPDPEDRRAKLVSLTTSGRQLLVDAGGLLGELEQELASRIGDEAVAQLRQVLECDWGPRPALDERRAAPTTGTSGPTRR